MNLKNALVIGFEAFKGLEHNHSGGLASSLGQQKIGDHVVTSLVISVDEAGARAAEMLTRENFEDVIILGVSMKKKKIGIEMKAFDLVPSLSCDTDLKSEANYLFTNMHIDKACLADSSSLQPSLNPGHYWCNALYYRLLSATKKSRILLIHLPLAKHVALNDQSTIVKSFLSCLWENKR